MFDILGLGTMVGALVAAGAAVWVGFLSHQQVKVSQKQVNISQEQIYIQARPILFPSGNPTFEDPTKPWLKWTENIQPINISNMGTGIALNVIGVLYGCEAYTNNGKIEPEEYAPHWTYQPPISLPSGVTDTFEENPFRVGKSNFSNGNRTICGSNLKAPPDSTSHLARITLTYDDMFGRKHASIFDWVYGSGWQSIGFFQDVKVDLFMLQKNPPLS